MKRYAVYYTRADGRSDGFSSLYARGARDAARRGFKLRGGDGTNELVGHDKSGHPLYQGCAGPAGRELLTATVHESAGI